MSPSRKKISVKEYLKAVRKNAVYIDSLIYTDTKRNARGEFQHSMRQISNQEVKQVKDSIKAILYLCDSMERDNTQGTLEL